MARRVERGKNHIHLPSPKMNIHRCYTNSAAPERWATMFAGRDTGLQTAGGDGALVRGRVDDVN